MRMVDLITKKRDHGELTDDELTWMIQQYTAEKIPDYQMSAFLMAVYFNGMSAAERDHFAFAMLHSGDVLDLSDIPGIKVAEHWISWKVFRALMLTKLKPNSNAKSKHSTKPL